ncbi:hypothetical protein MIR68_011395 [Amoeboaphelidium protococcarum]|nr:hypothetical protein MIR68_011395 [Amoeboaphelidium protococcarum]
MVLIHLPNISMTFLRPPPQSKPFTLHVLTQKHLTKRDIKSYFCSLYNVNPQAIADIRTFVPNRKRITHPRARIVAEVYKRQSMETAYSVYRWQTIRKHAIIELDPQVASQQSIDFRFPAEPGAWRLRELQKQEEEEKSKLLKPFKEQVPDVSLDVKIMENLSLEDDMTIGGSAKRRLRVKSRQNSDRK